MLGKSCKQREKLSTMSERINQSQPKGPCKRAGKIERGKMQPMNDDENENQRTKKPGKRLTTGKRF